MVKDVSIIVQARMGSSRLPGKVMRTIADKTLLGHIITRLKKSCRTCKLIIATGDTASDDVIEAECKEYGVICFRGSEKDVLGRFYHAAAQWNCKHINRVCADNPFVDPRLIDTVTEFYQENDYEYIAMRGFPVGVGFEIFTFDLLAEAYANGKEEHHREHVTPYMKESSAKNFFYRSETDMSRFRLTVDTEEDWETACRLYGKLYRGKHDFYLDDVVRYLQG